jgi:hypothetical protein
VAEEFGQTNGARNLIKRVSHWETGQKLVVGETWLFVLVEGSNIL